MLIEFARQQGDRQLLLDWYGRFLWSSALSEWRGVPFRGWALFAEGPFSRRGPFRGRALFADGGWVRFGRSTLFTHDRASVVRLPHLSCWKLSDWSTHREALQSYQGQSHDAHDPRLKVFEAFALLHNIEAADVRGCGGQNEQKGGGRRCCLRHRWFGGF